MKVLQNNKLASMRSQKWKKYSLFGFTENCLSILESLTIRQNKKKCLKIFNNKVFTWNMDGP